MKVEEFLLKLDTRSENMAKDLTDVRLTLAAQHAALNEHMRRTELLEEVTAVIRKDLAPIKTHVAVFVALGKIVAVVGAIVGIAVGVMQILGKVV